MIAARSALAAAVLVAGCAARTPKLAPAPVAAIAAPPAAPAPVDGTYRGTSTRYQADSRSCPSPGLVTLHVTDRQFLYRWTYADQVPVTIGPDGVLVPDDQGPVTVAGHLTPGGMEGDVTTPSCAVHFTVRRVDAAKQG